MSAAPDSLSPALERTLGNFTGILRRVAWRYRFSGADVDELAQEVRIRLWRAHGDQEGASEQIESIPASYLHRTALSAAIDLLRRRRARRSDRMISLEDDDPHGMPEVAGPDQDFAESELAEQVERAIESIHPSRRPAVRMHLMGHSRDEIAKVMGWTQAKARNLIYRGLADLRERLEAQGIRWTSQT
jgi:RNA polymerase sigma factor (sigma-70 family)